VFAAVRRHRNFRLFWFGQIISVSGTWMQNIGQAWLVLQLSHSAFLLGLVSALQFLPMLVFSLFGGVIADKLPKRNVLLGTQSAAMVQAFILFVLAATGVVQVWHIMVLAFCLGLVNALDMPTRQAFISEMVTREDLMNAISLNSAQFNAARVVGPGIAAGLIALLGIPALFLINAISYIAVLIGLWLMDPAQLHAPVARARQAERPLRQIREGVAFSLRSPVIRLALLLVFVISTFGMNFNIILPLFADSIYRSGASGFGLLSSVLGLGSLAAALVIAGTVKQPRVRLMVGSGMAFSLLEIGLSFTRSQLAAYPTLLLVGFSTIAFSATANTLLQANSPDYMRGRVMSLYTMVFAGSTPIGALVTGWLAAAYGAPAAVLVCALPGVATAAYGWLVASKVHTAPIGGQRAAGSTPAGVAHPGAAAPAREAGVVVPPVSSPPAPASAPILSAEADAAGSLDAPDSSTLPAGACDGDASQPLLAHGSM
jgi:MFS family permease